jgi:hypothetical protein
MTRRAPYGLSAMSKYRRKLLANITGASHQPPSVLEIKLTYRAAQTKKKYTLPHLNKNRFRFIYNHSGFCSVAGWQHTICWRGADGAFCNTDFK